LHSSVGTLSGDCGGGLGVINPGDHKKPGEAAVSFTGNWRYFSVTLGLVKSFRQSWRVTGPRRYQSGIVVLGSADPVAPLRIRPKSSPSYNQLRAQYLPIN
jgi:hypothetical protein